MRPVLLSAASGGAARSRWIFFDQLASADPLADFAFVRAVGEAFLGVFPKIVARRKDAAFDAHARDQLLVKRGRYVEFNLVYDRGTQFGFGTDADPEAYLMSLPPLVSGKRREHGFIVFPNVSDDTFARLAQSPCVRARQRSTAVHVGGEPSLRGADAYGARLLTNLGKGSATAAGIRLHCIARGCRLNVHDVCPPTKVDQARRRFDARDPLSSAIRRRLFFRPFQHDVSLRPLRPANLRQGRLWRSAVGRISRGGSSTRD